MFDNDIDTSITFSLGWTGSSFTGEFELSVNGISISQLPKMMLSTQEKVRIFSADIKLND